MERSEYLYQLSSTGDYALVESRTNFTEPFGGSIVGPDYAKLSLDLDSLNYPHKYNLLFDTAESYKLDNLLVGLLYLLQVCKLVLLQVIL
jgi:hypothetical protein